MTVEAAIEHPFYVFDRGWASYSPQLTANKYALKCSPLKVGDVCISLTHKVSSTSVTAGAATSTDSESRGQVGSPLNAAAYNSGRAKPETRPADAVSLSEAASSYDTSKTPVEEPSLSSSPHAAFSQSSLSSSSPTTTPSSALKLVKSKMTLSPTEMNAALSLSPAARDRRHVDSPLVTSMKSNSVVSPTATTSSSLLLSGNNREMKNSPKQVCMIDY